MAKRAKAKQQKRPDVPTADHVARQCNFQVIDHEPGTGRVRGVFPAAFELKVKRGRMETYLSLNWFEYFKVDLLGQYKGVVGALRGKGRTVKGSSAIARLNAGDVLAAGVARNLSLRIRDRSSLEDPAYCGLYGMPSDNTDPDLLVLLAKACLQVRKVEEIDAA